MQQKRLVLLFGALVVLLGVAYLTGVFESNVTTVDVPTLSIPADDLAQLRIEAPDQTVALTRQGTRWQLTEPIQATTDSAAVARFVQDLSRLELESIASNNPERYTRYGVDSTATVVTATWSGTTHRLVVGKQGPDFQAVYVRLNDDPRVYVTRGRLSPPQDLDRWRDKTIVNLPVSTIASVAVQQPGRSFTVRNGPNGWQITEQDVAAPADSAAVVQWLRRFAPMNADGFMDDVPAAVLDSATYQLNFQTTAGTTEAIRLVQRDDDYAVTHAGGATTFQLRSSRLSTFFPDSATLK